MSTFFDSDFEASTLPGDGWLDSSNGFLTLSAEQHLSGTKCLKVTMPAPGLKNISGLIERSHTSTTHLWARFGYRADPAFTCCTNDEYTKMIQFSGYNVPIIWIEWRSGSYELTVEYSYDEPTGTNNISAGISPSRTSWDQVEMEVQLNTPGVSNGYIKIWLNDSASPVIQLLNRQLIGPTTTSRALGGAGPLRTSDGFYNYTQIYNQDTGIGIVYFDRVAVGDTRIGVVGSVPDTTPPAVPTGVMVS